jgi:hypothetical protein
MDLARPEWTNFFREPRRKKAMARRAKTSHLGAFQLLPEHVLLSCLARLPREDHDAVADCSTGFRAVMRGERFLKARRAEDITEEALVLVCPGDAFMALVSGRVWRRLTPQPVHWRSSSPGAFRTGTTVIGSELFIAGQYLTGYDAVDDEWFTLPRPKRSDDKIFSAEAFAVGCAGRLFMGDFTRLLRGQAEGQGRPFDLKSWDPDAQTWIEHPTMPPPLMQRYSHSYQLVAVAAGSEIFILDRCDPVRFRVFDVGTETWSSVSIPLGSRPENPRDSGFTGDIRSQPWPSLWVDRSLIHLSHHGFGGHRAYDTVNGHWIYVYRSMPRHTVSSESDRVLSVINHNGPDDYIRRGNYASARWRGGVRVYERRGTDFMTADEPEVALPVLYNVVERVCYVAMP